jgi:hypothetical protein
MVFCLSAQQGLTTASPGDDADDLRALGMEYGVLASYKYYVVPRSTT